MDKDLVIQILEGKSITSDQLNNFIVDYVKEELSREPTGEELNGIRQALQMGIFNLRFAASNMALKLNLRVMNVFDKNGTLIKTDVYED